MKVAVVGIGYVGLSLAALLAQHNEVVALDVVPEKIAMLNNKQSPIEDDKITIVGLNNCGIILAVSSKIKPFVLLEIDLLIDTEFKVRDFFKIFKDKLCLEIEHILDIK